MCNFPNRNILNFFFAFIFRALFWGEYAQRGCSSPSSCLDYTLRCVTCHRRLALLYSSSLVWSSPICSYDETMHNIIFFILFYARLTFSLSTCEPWADKVAKVLIWFALYHLPSIGQLRDHQNGPCCFGWGITGLLDTSLTSCDSAYVKYLDFLSVMAIIQHLGRDGIPC